MLDEKKRAKIIALLARTAPAAAWPRQYVGFVPSTITRTAMCNPPETTGFCTTEPKRGGRPREKTVAATHCYRTASNDFNCHERGGFLTKRVVQNLTGAKPQETVPFDAANACRHAQAPYTSAVRRNRTMACAPPSMSIHHENTKVRKIER